MYCTPSAFSGVTNSPTRSGGVSGDGMQKDLPHAFFRFSVAQEWLTRADAGQYQLPGRFSEPLSYEELLLCGQSNGTV
jgi:hypothetical protein